jgi:hypothetical protein
MEEFLNNLKLRHTLEERFGLYRGWAAHVMLAEFRNEEFWYHIVFVLSGDGNINANYSILAG